MTLDAAAYLAERGLVRAGVPLSVERLGGGVSSEIVAVRGPGVRLVVKRALPRLSVEEEWLSDPARVVREAEALRFARALTPEAVPEVVDVDAERCIATMTLAPDGWVSWRDELLAGRIDAALGRRLGELLARWHAARVPPSLADAGAFVELRIDPFHRTVAERHPRLAPQIEAVAKSLLERPRCLVHGDFSPKIVLFGAGGLWVLDWEVAHYGDPVFDLAFLLTHLLLKSIHRPADARAYRGVAKAFLDAYGGVRGELAANVGCLLLARVDGKSPAPYLRPAEQERVRELGRDLLADPPPAILEAWDRLR